MSYVATEWSGSARGFDPNGFMRYLPIRGFQAPLPHRFSCLIFDTVEALDWQPVSILPRIRTRKGVRNGKNELSSVYVILTRLCRLVAWCANFSP